MKIGIVSPEFPPDIGGVETYAYEYARRLAGMGHQVTVFASPRSREYTPQENFQVVPVLQSWWAWDRRLPSQYPMDAWHVMNAAYARLASVSEAPVVVSAHGDDFLKPYIPLADPNLGYYLRLKDTPTWLGSINRFINDACLEARIRKGFERVRHILLNSRYTERVFLERFPECAGKTTAAWVGIGEEWFALPLAPDKPPEEPVRIITVARLSAPRKNVDLVLRALAPLASRHRFTYTVIGEGYLKDRLVGLARDLGLVDRVEFTGYLENGAIRERLARGDLFVLVSSILPGSHEGFGIAYLEASACGTPVLAARKAGATEAVEEGVSGFFVEDTSVEAVTSALDSFLSGRHRFDRQACRHFAERFGWDKVVAAALPHYGPPD